MNYVEIISQVGFPIFCVLLMVLIGKYLYDNTLAQQEKDRQERIDLEKRIEDMNVSIVNLTVSIKELSESISRQTETLVEIIKK